MVVVYDAFPEPAETGDSEKHRYGLEFSLVEREGGVGHVDVLVV